MRFFTMLISLFLLSISSLQASSSLSPAKLPAEDVGFVARLIHRTSPQSPFYNSSASREDIQRESIRTSEARSHHFSQRIPSGSSTPLAPLSHDFIMQYSIGTPPVQTYGIPDTASYLIWLQCEPCYTCYKQFVPLFNWRNSSTLRDVLCDSPECRSIPHRDCFPDFGDERCSYYVEYADKSLSSGLIFKETFTYVSAKKTTVTLGGIIFGCGSFNEDTSDQGIPGVVGLQFASISFIGQLRSRSFSYCHNQGQTGGFIRFGSEALINLGHNTPILQNNYGNYHLILEGINIGGQKVDFSRDFFAMGDDEETGFIIDSGTTYTLLYTEAYDEFLSALKESMKPKNWYRDHGWELCYVDITDAPEIEFQFRNMKLPLSNDNAWTFGPHGLQCLAIRRTPNRLSMFGMYQQRNINVGFDLANGQLWMRYQNYCPEV